MDERHWWIAGKIQESFKIGDNESTKFLESFMCQESILSKVNTFLKAGGPCRIFFYGAKSCASDVPAKVIHCTESLAALKDVDLEIITILYFLRNKTDRDVDPTKMEKDIFCGELKHNTIETLNSLLVDIYIPLIKAQKDWGQCSEDGQANLMLSMDKFVTALNETTASVSQHSHQMVLKQPKSVIEKDLKMICATALDPQVIINYEELIGDWINTIEAVFNDVSGESILDPNAGPLSELEKWRRKQRLLTHVVEQLKGKECKAILTVLITAKSKQLKKWKIIDASITDGLNDAKDKVKYIESLKRHFDQMYDTNPINIMKNVIPGFVNAIKQMESISRFYARTGFLGALLTKVTNQLVLVCKNYIKQHTYNVLEDRDELWDRVVEETTYQDLQGQSDPHHTFLQQILEKKLQTKLSREPIAPDNNLCARLQTCLSLQTFYRESLRSLRESLVKSQNHSRLSSISSFSTVNNPVKKEIFSPIVKPSHNKQGIYTSGPGVPLTDEHAILAHFDTFSKRIHKVLEVLNTMSQFIKLRHGVTDIPRPRKEDLTAEKLSEPQHNKHRKPKDPSIKLTDKEVDEHNFDVPKILVTDSNDSPLSAIKEDEELVQTDRTDNFIDTRAEHSHCLDNFGSFHDKLLEEEISVLKKYYPENNDIVGPPVSTVLEQHLTKVTEVLRNNVTTQVMLDVESKEKERFDFHYCTFQNIVHDLEKFIKAYLHIIFKRKMTTQQGLDIISKFNPAANNSGISGTVAEMYVKVFEWYESDLHEVQKIYENQKDCPCLVRNAPPVAGAIYWSRQLLKRIEDPMKIFQNNKAVTTFADFGNQVRIYNRLATALVTYESLWFTQWKKNIEQTCHGLRATLFVLHPETGEIVVNSDDKILELIHEAKWMTRLGIEIPNSAMSVMRLEERFKSYKSHLELALKNFREVCQTIPGYLLKLFNPHIENVLEQFHPGLTTLTWNNLNIDVFLHQTCTATQKLRDLMDRVNHVLEEKVSRVIAIIKETCFYDTDTAFSHTWSVIEFCSEMTKSIKDRSVVLGNHIATILGGLKTIIEILTTKKQADYKHHFKEKKSWLTGNSEEYAKYKLDPAREAANVQEIMAYFKDQVFQAVLNATYKSLASLAHACGCTGEVIRTFTPVPFQETQSTCSSPSPSGWDNYFSSANSSRVNSAHSREQHSPGNDQSKSHLTNSPEEEWPPGKTKALNTLLQFKVDVKFSIPNIIIEPTIDVVQKAITTTADSILEALKEISWIDKSNSEMFFDLIIKDFNVQELYSQLTTIIEDLGCLVDRHLFHFSYYNFLWKDDMCGNFNEFIMADPGDVAIKREVERYLHLEKKVKGIQSRLPVGPIILFSNPIRDSLHGFSKTWKTKFASVLHEEAKKRLDSVVSYRSNVMTKLEQHVQTLDQLNSTLHLLEELRDMENKIDGMYLPIETMYAKLREFELRLPRTEIEEVQSLRDKWSGVMQLADHVREELLNERKEVFEEELDKQVKTFVVEVIQFRNVFDAQGPAVLGIQPIEAVLRLYDFQHRFSIYDAKRKTLNSVSKLFSIPCKTFPELDKTGEELELLSQLYGLFQKLINFDNKFRDTLWADVDLKHSSEEVDGFWDECLALPSKLKDWEAYSDLKNRLNNYLEVFPLLQKLSSKEIRNRHWLQVMQVSHSSFPLEGSVFKMSYILNIELTKYKVEVEEICNGARRELELEIKMRMTEEEWTEQVLNFEHYKKRGPIFLDKSFTERLLEQLEDAKALLATMLTSRYIGPLRDEAASWAEKLKEVAEVLELWLDVQDLWHYLEAVFSNSLAVKELSQEAKKFAQIDKGWTKMMKRAFDTRNVLQCCYGDEPPKVMVLRNIYDELEVCFKSLVGFLENKRQTFPRFYFVSDQTLIALLSRPNDMESVRPHLRSIFSAIADVTLEPTNSSLLADNGIHISSHTHSMKLTSGKVSSQPDQTVSSNAHSFLPPVKTPRKIDKRLHQHYNMNPSGQVDASIMLPSEGLINDVIVMDVTAVLSTDGEILNLIDKVTLNDDVEVWLGKMRDSVGGTLQYLNQAVIIDCQNGIGIEEWAFKYPSQVCQTGMLYHWTIECEAAIAEIRNEKKSLQMTLRKYNLATSKLTTVLLRGLWKNIDAPVLPMHRLRLEAMISHSIYLKDILENLCQRKLRDTTDFEWRRLVRCYFQPVQHLPTSASTNRSSTATPDDRDDVDSAEVKLMPQIWILDSHYEYGSEFCGAETGVPTTPVTEKCFLAMSLALKQIMGSLLVGPPGSGKTETVKGLAHLLGNYVGVFQVSKEHDPSCIAKIFHGIAMDGCWGYFDEVHSLSKHSLSVLLDYSHSIFQALRAEQSYVHLMNGTEIPLHRTVGLFLSANISNTPNNRLPSDITEVFRTVSLIMPDIGLVLKAKCSSMGFRAPAMLANRLKLLAELVKDQLPPEIHHYFTAQTFLGALPRAMQKKQKGKESRILDKQNLKDETSRSESQSSESPTSRNRHSTVNAVTNKMSYTSIVCKPGTPVSLTTQSKQDHALVCEAIEEIISPRLTAENHAIFKNILTNCFYNLPKHDAQIRKTSGKEHKLSSANVESSKTHVDVADFESALIDQAVESRLVPHKPWINKCLQLYTLSQVYSGIIVAGPPGCGKSSCIQTVVKAYGGQTETAPQTSHAGKTSNITMHRLLHMNPMVVDDLAIIFGSIGPNNEWIDGIFTHAIKKANRNLSTTWICLDGILHQSWTDSLSRILSKEKVLHLKNGDKLFLSERIKLLFETNNLNDTSPSIVSSCGILYIDSDVVGWRPIARAWLDTRTNLEAHVLQKAFQKTMDTIISFVFNEAKPYLQLSKVGMLKTCLGLLEAMLADNIEILGELHIERLYLFCLMWSFGGLLDRNDQKSFGGLLKTLSTAMPDDDREICVFDYYVDESGEWDPWHSRMPEVIYTGDQHILGEVYVETLDTVRTHMFMELSAASSRNVLLVGPHGSGKTAIINSFINRQDTQQSVCKRMVFSGASNAKQLQQLVESNIYHRQGFVYGALDKKKLKIFIDDISLPMPDHNGTHKCNELLRQLLDGKQFCTLHKPFEWHTVEDLSVISAMTFTDRSTGYRSVTDRLMHHFSVFWLPAPQDYTLRDIVHGILEVNMKTNGVPGLDLDLHNAIVSASCDMLGAIQNVLQPSPMDGRNHYLFTLKDITTCFQCLRRLAYEGRVDKTIVVSLWKHELSRTVRDRITRTSDLIWFDQKLDEIIKGTWQNINSDLLEHFITFSADPYILQQPATSTGSKQFKVSLESVKNIGDLHSCLKTHLTRYSEIHGNNCRSVMLSDYVISQVVRLHRVLSFNYGGNLLLIGALGSHLSTLCQLALHIAEIPIHKMDTTNQTNFLDGLRSAFRLCGSEGKVISLLFTAKDLHDPSYLDVINSLLICGEYPLLFSNDETDDLLQAILPTIKKEFPGSSIDPMQFFVSRVKSNLHLLICLQPSHELLKTARSHFPGLLKGCQMNWMCDWPKEALLSEASYFVTKHQLCEDFENLRETITETLASIHSFVLRFCRQLPWAGDDSKEIPMISYAAEEKKTDQTKNDIPLVSNLPYSKVILHDRIKLKHRDTQTKAKNEIYVGPTTYGRFLETFRQLFLQKSEERTRSVEKLKKAIATLDVTRADTKIMKKAIRTTTAQLELAQENTTNLLNRLTLKVTVLEKLKAKVGLSRSLDVYLQLNEMDIEEDGMDELLKEEEYDEYDAEFDRMRETNLKTRGVQAKEELTHIQAQFEECRASLAYARDQVMIWRSKVDRSVIERIRAFQNPPLLVGQVIEMVLMLIGKRLPSQRITEVRESFPGKEELSSHLSTSSGSSKPILKKVKIKETGERFDKMQWKSMQQTMTDSVKFVDMLHNISWEDGLSKEVLAAVESYLACSKEGQLGVTGEGSLLENAHSKQFQASKYSSPSPGARGGLTIAGVKYASEDCATLVHYAIAIVEYSRLCGPLRMTLEKLHELKREIEENEDLQKQQEQQSDNEEKPVQVDEEEDLSETDLPRIQEDIEQLQAEFDQSVVEKHCLEVELQSMEERLNAALVIVDSLKSHENKWTIEMKENDCNELLIANCITAAGILTYCGAFNIDIRHRMGTFFIEVCEQNGLPLHREQLLRNLKLSDFLHTPLDVIKLQQQQLPINDVMLENVSFVMQPVIITAWPLVCDPTSQFIDWLQCLYADKQLIVVKYCDIKSQLDNCLSDGTPLLVTDCDVNSLIKDQRFTSTLQNCANFFHGKSRFKVTVADHEVECDPSFHLFLHTMNEPNTCPNELAMHTSVTFFQQSRTGMEEEFLDIFLAQEKSRLNNELITIRKEKQENLEMLESLEQQMRDQLSSDIRLMTSLQVTKRLVELKMQFDETLESQALAQASEDTVIKAREAFCGIAKRAAICFDTAQYMREVNPLYQTSFKQFVFIYQAAVTHSERSSIKALIDRLTFSAFLTAARGFLEKDRFMYALLLAIEVEDSHGNVGQGEREFIISPNFSSSVMLMVIANQNADSHITHPKKPFDWMADEQYQNLQILATHFDWFKDIFERISKDGQETFWRNLCESEFPENMPLPDKMEETLKPIQKLCILRAVRSDRLLQASSCFISHVLDKKYTADIPIDLPNIFKQSTPSLPIMLLFDTEAKMAVNIFRDFCSKKQNQSQTVIMTDNSILDEKAVKKQIIQGMTEGAWILLHNAHNSHYILNYAETILNEGLQKCDINFRLWISVHVGSSEIPDHLLQNSIKVYIDSPKVMRDCLVRSFSLMEPDILKQSDRPEWPAMLHNLCFLHAAINLRTRFGGWNQPYEFSSIGFDELQDSISFSMAEFKEPLLVTAADGSLIPRTLSWAGIRYMLSEIVYGTHITDIYDQQCLSAMVDLWCCSSAVKKDFEVTRLKYKTPAVFFNPNLKLPTLIQAFDGLTKYFLETPEACHLLPNTEVLLGDDQYILTRLNKIFDAMPSSSSLSHQLFSRPPTPFSGPALAGVSNQSQNPLVVDQGVSSSVSLTAYKTKKDIDLWETCHSMLQKVPKSYSKEFLAEKVKKVGGFTAFNNLILKEMELMYRLLHEIRTSLQAIKSATESNALGDCISQHTLDVADDIYHQRIPSAWCRISGNSAPSQTYGLGQWLTELQNRCHHFEKILTLGRKRMPAYWLGAFFNPRGLLALLKQDSLQKYASERSGSFDIFTFQTELTSRDKEHLRDPPQEGMFIWGLHLWGCSWERTSGDLQDSPPRASCSGLPVVHVTCWPVNEKPSMQDSVRALETYSCPVYHSRQAHNEVVLELDMRKENTHASRWALRGVCATIRPN